MKFYVNQKKIEIRNLKLQLKYISKAKTEWSPRSNVKETRKSLIQLAELCQGKNKT